eukprot:9471731-Pyramimonas_sp.AAC.1
MGRSVGECRAHTYMYISSLTFRLAAPPSAWWGTIARSALDCGFASRWHGSGAHSTWKRLPVISDHHHLDFTQPGHAASTRYR